MSRLVPALVRGERTYSLLGKTFVKAKLALLLRMCCLPLAISAQKSPVIPLASEPHPADSWGTYRRQEKG